MLTLLSDMRGYMLVSNFSPLDKITTYNVSVALWRSWRRTNFENIRTITLDNSYHLKLQGLFALDSFSRSQNENYTLTFLKQDKILGVTARMV